MNALKEIPTWAVLASLFVILLIAYYVRPDNVTEDSAKGVLAALLLSLQSQRNQQPPPKNPEP